MDVCNGCEFLKDIKCQETHKLVLHAPAYVIYGPTKDKGQRDQFMRDLKRNISALRNSGGGVVFVHIQNLDPSDRCLDAFHELVDERLNTMIEDGSLFVTVYKKDWINENVQNKGVVAIVVSPSSSVVTIDFKSKLPLDSSVVDPSTAAIFKLLRKDVSFGIREARIRGLDYFKLRENRQIQVKAVIEGANQFLDNIDRFVDHIWERLRLREYLTAFCKLEFGGSVFFGIEEEPRKFATYKSKRLNHTGFCFNLSQENFINKLLERIRSETTVLGRVDNEVKVIKGAELVSIAFYRVPRADNCYVLEVAVAGVDGLVFYDAKGPEAYEIGDNSRVLPINLDKWCSLLTREVKWDRRNQLLTA